MYKCNFYIFITRSKEEGWKTPSLGFAYQCEVCAQPVVSVWRTVHSSNIFQTGTVLCIRIYRSEYCIAKRQRPSSRQRVYQSNSLRRLLEALRRFDIAHPYRSISQWTVCLVANELKRDVKSIKTINGKIKGILKHRNQETVLYRINNFVCPVKLILQPIERNGQYK